MTARPVPRRAIWAIAVLLGLSVLLIAGGFGGAALAGKFYSVPSQSMEGTVSPGDHVLVDLTSDVRRGDVVVFMSGTPNASPGAYIGRVVGVGGDHVASAGNGAKVTVNGKALDETYLYPGDAPSEKPFNATVPPGRLWLMGDHRSIANDSRFDRGPVETSAVVGRVFLRFSTSGVQRLDTPRTFLENGLAAARTYPPATVIGLYAGATGILLLLVTGAAAWILHLRQRRWAQTVRPWEPAQRPPGH